MSTPLELWHAIYDAAVEAGLREEAAEWADEQYWPYDVACPDPDVRRQTSPFRDPGKWVTR